MTREEIQKALQDKLDAGYEAYRKSMVARGADIVFENAAEIYYNQQAYDELSGGGYALDLMEYLLRYKDPLEVVRDQWQVENNVSIKDEMGHALWEITDKQAAEAAYDLDEHYILGEPQSEQGQQMG